ncbi:MAG: hypothetical protein K2W96_17190 [Gemmataceae bacterium]|nr:hypothetical protein [Gemmataceae bacterium]
MKKLASETRRKKAPTARAAPPPAYVLTVQTLAPAPYEVLKPFQVAMEPSGEDCVASFVEANINASGCDAADALANLKDLIVSRCDALGSRPAEKLAAPMKRQWNVLLDHFRLASANVG